MVVAFDGQIVCGGSTQLQSFDGTSVTTHATGLNVRDFYLYNGYLYVLTSTGIYRTDSLATPLELFSGASIPSDATSIAAWGGTLYLGGERGKVYKADVSVASSQITLIAAEDCFTFNSSTGTITGYGGAGCGASVIIPETIGGVPVTAIGGMAFYDKQITDLTIPNSITSIGYAAFSVNPLTNLSIDMSTIPASVFNGSQAVVSIRNLTFGPHVTTIGVGAFGSNGIESLDLPSSVTSIGSSAFQNNQLTSLVIPNSVTSIGSSAFTGNQITSLTLGNSLTSVGNTAFQNNQLTSLTIPNSVTSIGQQAFQNNQLTSLTIPNSVTSIGWQAFSGNQITSLNVDLTSISSGIFGTSLTRLTLGPNVRHISTDAFAGGRLATLVIPEGVESIGDRAFAGNPIILAHIESSAVPGVDAFGGSIFDSLFLGCISAMNPPLQTLPEAIPCYNQAAEQARPATDEIMRIYTPYPENYTNGILFVQEMVYSGLLGVPAPTLHTGAALVNPGSIQTMYRSTAGAELSPSTIQAGPKLTDYKLSSAYSLKPDLTNADFASLYYLQGNAFSVVPPTIDGYRTPASYSGVLSAPMTLIEFVYARSTIGASNGILRPIVTLHSLDQNIDADEAPTEQGWPVPSLEEVEEFKEHLASLPKSSEKSFGTVLGEWITKHPGLALTGAGLVAGVPTLWWLVGALRRRRRNAN